VAVTDGASGESGDYAARIATLELGVPVPT